MDWISKYSKFLDTEALRKTLEEKKSMFDYEVNQPFLNALEDLPEIESSKDFSSNHVRVCAEVDHQRMEKIKLKAEQLIPWRKGPFDLFGMEIDAEWRSDKKWERLEKVVDNLKGKRVLDIGCNNGYFMFRMAHQNPEFVLGIDPVVPYWSQFKFINHFAKCDNLEMELLGVEDCVLMDKLFDVVFSMGIIYHHRNPIQQLLDIKKAMKPGGQLILETIGIPGDDPVALFPEDRYAKMRNVWFVPTLSCLVNFAKKARFGDIEIVSDTPLTSDEQRLTEWCPPPRQSLEDFLDPEDSSKTVEGHPAPRRFLISCRKKLGDQN
jgi:tRNA (mo5U34)-methyltransferase